MTQPRDKKEIFLPKTPTLKTGPSNLEVGCETLESFLERESKEFENISEEGQSPSPHTMAGEE
jgi:hypothetical protein